MLLFLASYPRSGNTFLRIILNEIFNLPSVDIHGAQAERAFIENKTIFKAFGGLTHELEPDDIIDEAKKSHNLFLIKTHERPKSDDPAIYLVRDGRSSIISYYHYIRDVEQRHCSLQEVITGQVYGGSWSEHIYDWSPESRKRTLLVRFENLAKNPAEEIERISQFLSMNPQSKCISSFEYLKSAFPNFFRSGNDEKNIRELTESGLEELFWRWHTPMMVRMGYSVS